MLQLAALCQILAALPLTRATEVPVKLFAQDCLITGPFPESVLMAIHSISPAQAGAVDSPGTVADGLQRLGTAKGVPAALDSYRERLTKRLLAFRDLYRGLEDLRSKETPTATNDTLDQAVAKHARGPMAKKLQTLLAPWKAKDFQPTESAIEGLSLAFGDAVEPDPEEEFHRVSTRIGIRYSCDFEGVGED